MFFLCKFMSLFCFITLDFLIVSLIYFYFDLIILSIIITIINISIIITRNVIFLWVGIMWWFVSDIPTSLEILLLDNIVLICMIFNLLTTITIELKKIKVLHHPPKNSHRFGESHLHWRRAKQYNRKMFSTHLKSRC